MNSIEKNKTIHLLPRIYIETKYETGTIINLDDNNSHYLRNILRLNDGDNIRIFNDHKSEFLAQIQHSGKKQTSLIVLDLLRQCSTNTRNIHLIFSPLKKDRMDFLIEKSVELGVTDLHPTILNRSVVRDINDARINAQIINAAEQCERLDIPSLHPITNLPKLLHQWEKNIAIIAALERHDYPSINSVCATVNGDIAYLVGGEGGISSDEMDMLLKYSFVKPVNLGPRILRSETAALFGLSVIGATQDA